MEEEKVALPEDSLVSMNLWGFHPSIFESIREHFIRFAAAHKDDPRAEFYIPLVVNDLMEKGLMKVAVLPSKEKWYGVTYKEDKATVQAALSGLNKEEVYPDPLWS